MLVLECQAERVGIHQWKVRSCRGCLHRVPAPWSRGALRGHLVLPQAQSALEEAIFWGRKGQGRRELC